MMENQPKTRKLPAPKRTPRRFLFFIALRVPKPDNNATKPNIITIPMGKPPSFKLISLSRIISCLPCYI